MMSRTSVSIPEELKRRMEQVSGAVNWSFVAARAFEEEVNGRDPGMTADEFESDLGLMTRSRNDPERTRRYVVRFTREESCSYWADNFVISGDGALLLRARREAGTFACIASFAPGTWWSVYEVEPRGE